ncbi:hypothetical protein XFF6992_70068 [Xanthomonas citri pv. fuscans]|nr:hypothetical protein XFF6992_70068 [Xanthomonas citri pv. fuscans]
MGAGVGCCGWVATVSGWVSKSDPLSDAVNQIIEPDPVMSHRYYYWHLSQRTIFGWTLHIYKSGMLLHLRSELNFQFVINLRFRLPLQDIPEGSQGKVICNKYLY